MIAEKMIAENEGGGSGRMNEVNIEPRRFRRARGTVASLFHAIAPKSQ
jgi:hypothetical protein